MLVRSTRSDGGPADSLRRGRRSVSSPTGDVDLAAPGRARSLRILVTGSSGVIGRAVTLDLERSGHRVARFDVRETDGSETSRSCARDVRSLTKVRDSARSVDGVVHLAAVSRAAAAERDPELAYAVNVEGTRHVLEALEPRDAPAWIVFASSREVYGDPDSVPVNEEHPLRPKGVYGRTKVAGERLVREWADSEGRRAIVLRFSNIFGDVRDYPERVLPAFITAALRNHPLEVRGPGCGIDLLHIDDAVSAVRAAIRLLVREPPRFDTFNIASGRGVTLGALAQQVIAATDSRSVIRTVPAATWTMNAYVGDITRAAERLDWKPEKDFQEGLRELIDRFRRANRDS